MTVTPVVSVSEFRTNFKAFANVEAYPEDAVQFYLNWATILFNPNRWLSVLPLGIQLYTAHFLTEDRAAYLAAQAGQPAGNVPGPLTQKTVDKTSLTYDINAVIEKDAGDWNATMYGRRLYRLLMIAGMGPIQVGIGWTPPWVWNGTTGAWPGPPGWPGWFGGP